ncbi:glycosyltransferase family 4 protein [Ancylobacter pratisalsi]|uniref:Glycosyltransferase family 4 protein n=1 Tax=Ancylobacter pratisalsi TaxID=1745854 RepID=A0A6P1YLF8_9HYPH|nr:glycosyltransferase family 4 protein [Ancylobacter pratisalsi]QIB34267.1 glycosyltransferase family 4 protein [Ancylobacter pratisalsi]
MKIAIYSSHFRPSIGGMEAIAEMLAEEFQRCGHEVVVLTETTYDGKDEFPFPVMRHPSRMALLAACRRCDVILAMPLALHSLPILLASGRPVFIRHPSPLGNDARLRPVDRLKRFVARFTNNIVQSRYMASVVRNAVIIRNPYDDKTFFTSDMPRSTDLLFVGRLSPVKGCDTLIEAFAGVADEFPEVRLNIVGVGDFRDTLEQLVAQHELSTRVTFMGPKRGDELAEIMRRHKVLVVPSRYHEPFGIVALEGLGCGCLPIVSRHGGLVDAIGPHGLTFENGDADDLERCLRRVLQEPGLSAELLQGVEGHLREHEKNPVAQRYLDVLSERVKQ